MKTILAKSTPHFWARLLLSMIALFALPAVYASHIQNPHGENYQTQSTQTQPRSCKTVSLAQRIQAKPLGKGRSAVKSAKLFKIEPHFLIAFFASHAPIRGSPAV